jgi:hypothetical protein
LYFIAGGQHGVSASPTRGLDQNPRNILDYRPVLRALLIALDHWASAGAEPPASIYPRLADKTLVTNETYRATFPKIPGVNLPQAPYAPLRLDFGPRWKTERIADQIPPQIGPAYVTLVPAVGLDGNELAGIHLPDIDVPIATFTGWNLRGPKAGAEGELTRLNGVLFAVCPLGSGAGDHAGFASSRDRALSRARRLRLESPSGGPTASDKKSVARRRCASDRRTRLATCNLATGQELKANGVGCGLLFCSLRPTAG